VTERVLVLRRGLVPEVRLLDGGSGGGQGTLTHSVEAGRTTPRSAASRTSRTPCARPSTPSTATARRSTAGGRARRWVTGSCTVATALAEPVLVDDRMLDTVEDLVPPRRCTAQQLEGLRVALRPLPRGAAVAGFDTAFHQTMPEHAHTYAAARELAPRSTGSGATAFTARRTPSSRVAPRSCSAARPRAPTSRCCTSANGAVRSRDPRWVVRRHLDGAAPRSRDW
jgi:hypothetical protein